LSTRSLHFSHGGEGAGEGGEGGEVSVSRRRARRSSQVPEPQLEPWPAEAKAEVPAHAQRMSSLLASEREFALCRVETRVDDVGREAGGWQATASSVQGRARLHMWGTAWGGAHVEHVVHVCETGRVEAQRLIERRRALPKRGHVMQGELRAGTDGGDAASGVQGRARLQIWGIGYARSTRGAHVEHASHVCDAGRVEAQRLVERRRVLPTVERRAFDAGRAVGCRADWGDAAFGVQGRARLQIWRIGHARSAR